MKEKKLRPWLVSLFALLVVGLDQLTKYLTVKYIPLGGRVPVIPGLVHLTYVRNEGAAFSMFSGMRWIFVALVFVFLIVLFFLLKKGAISKPFEIWCMAAVAGGAVGNAFDRILVGTVCDMIEVEFVRFAVFNVADSFITVGVILLAISVIFFSKDKKHEAASGS